MTHTKETYMRGVEIQRTVNGGRMKQKETRDSEKGEKREGSKQLGYDQQGESGGKVPKG